MRVFHSLSEYGKTRGRAALTIGNFDGVHRGHQQLLAGLREKAEEGGGDALVITFEPHPATVLAPGRAPPRLTTLDERLALLERCSVDAVVVLRSEPALFALSAGEFVRELVEHCRPLWVVEGVEFRFGRERRGSIQTLREAGAQHGFSVLVVNPIVCRELEGAPVYSSSAVREAVAEGRVDVAATLLGRPHRIVGIVAAGDGRGAAIGFPTANLSGVAQLTPGHGVYAAVAQTEDDRLLPSAVNIGPQPTFDQSISRVEAHLIDFDGDLRDRRLALYSLSRLRGQSKFAGIAELTAQIAEDVASAKRIAAASLSSVRAAAWPL